MFKEKKSQVTIFIIVGIVILITAGVLIYIQTDILRKGTAPGIKRAAEVPVELLPISNYVESSMKIKAEQGMKILQEHGGYIYFEGLAPNYAQPTEGDALEFFPGTNFLVPYWYYMKSDNDCQGNCIFASKMPMLCRSGRECITQGDNSIEEQLDRYINNELKSILNFDELENQGYDIKEQGDIETTAAVTDDYINIYVKYPLEVKRGGTTQKIDEFSISIESDLAEMYEMAYEIANYESQNCFIGKHVGNYYSAFYGLDQGRLPPIYEMTVGTQNMRIWSLIEVKELIKEKTKNAMDVMGIFNQRTFSWPSADENDQYYDTIQGLLSQYVFYPLTRYHDATVSLSYNPWWNPYLDIRPRQGGIITPTNFGGAGGLAAILSSITATKIYEFFYQYSFPVVVEIRKTNERGEQLFRFALEPNIRANKCFGPNATMVHSAPVSQSALCEDSGRTIDLSLTVRDDSNSEPLSDVGVSFYAGETCLLGTTNSDGMLTTKYPRTFGRGSMILLEKEGHLNKFISIPDLPANTQVRLKPIRTKNISLKMIDMTTLSQMASATSMSDAMAIRDSSLKIPNESESMLIQLNRGKDSYQDNEFSSIIYFEDGAFMPETVELLPGRYNISVQLFVNQEVTIPEERDRICAESVVGSCKKVELFDPCPDKENCYIIARCDEDETLGLGGCSLDKEVILTEIILPLVPSNGGVVYDDWHLTDYNYLDNGDNLTIYLFRQDIPERHSDLSDLGKYEVYSETYRYALEPEIR